MRHTLEHAKPAQEVMGQRRALHGMTKAQQAPEVEVLHRSSGDEGLLGVVQYIGLGVHARLVVGHIHAHGLLAHSRLVRVPGGLVAVREGDDGGTHPKDHGGVDLTVSEVGCAGHLWVVPCIGQVSYVHGYHGGLLFFGVQVPTCSFRTE